MLGMLEFRKNTFVKRLFRPFPSCLYLLPVGYLVPPAERLENSGRKWLVRFCFARASH